MNKYIILCIGVLFYIHPAGAQLQNTGWKRPTAIHAPNAWTNPQNAFSSDDQYAEVIHQSGCRCPFMDLSWDDGTSWTSSTIFGPYGTTDSWRTNGDSTDTWGHPWTDTELLDSLFVLRIWNSSTLYKQGYSHFGFGIPSGSTISGIEVHVEAHGDSNYTYDYVDAIEVRIYYSLPTLVYTAGKSPLIVYPNPANDYLKFLLPDDVQRCTIKLSNLQGSNVISNVFENIISNQIYSLDIGDLPAGIYFLSFFDGKQESNRRIIIQ